MGGLFRMLVVVLLLGLAACGDTSPQGQLTAIEEKLAKGFPVTAENRAEVDEYVAEGRRLMGAGDQKRAAELLGKALDILEAAEDADRFNKSE